MKLLGLSKEQLILVFTFLADRFSVLANAASNTNSEDAKTLMGLQDQGAKVLEDAKFALKNNNTAGLNLSNPLKKQSNKKHKMTFSPTASATEPAKRITDLPLEQLYALVQNSKVQPVKERSVISVGELKKRVDLILDTMRKDKLLPPVINTPAYKNITAKIKPNISKADAIRTIVWGMTSFDPQVNTTNLQNDPAAKVLDTLYIDPTKGKTGGLTKLGQDVVASFVKFYNERLKDISYMPYPADSNSWTNLRSLTSELSKDPTNSNLSKKLINDYVKPYYLQGIAFEKALTVDAILWQIQRDINTEGNAEADKFGNEIMHDAVQIVNNYMLAFTPESVGRHVVQWAVCSNFGESYLNYCLANGYRTTEQRMQHALSAITDLLVQHGTANPYVKIEFTPMVANNGWVSELKNIPTPAPKKDKKQKANRNADNEKERKNKNLRGNGA